MSKPVIKVENLSKEYRRGVMGYNTFKESIIARTARRLGREDPNSKVQHDDGAPVVAQRFLALDDVSFEIAEGDAFGIIGKNGSGKSTLLKILSGITTPTKGMFSISGKVASLLEVGTGFHPEMTGRENVYLNGAILGMKKFEIDRVFDEIVDFSGVETFIDTPVKRYSSGMYVRLAFSVAAHLVSDIVILDEVLAVGDAMFQQKSLHKMESIIHDAGRTVLFVSHDDGAVRQLCNRCLWLDGGRVAMQGDTDEVIKHYRGEVEAAIAEEQPQQA